MLGTRKVKLVCRHLGYMCLDNGSMISLVKFGEGSGMVSGSVEW